MSLLSRLSDALRRHMSPGDETCLLEVSYCRAGQPTLAVSFDHVSGAPPERTPDVLRSNEMRLLLELLVGSADSVAFAARPGGVVVRRVNAESYLLVAYQPYYFFPYVMSLMDKTLLELDEGLQGPARGSPPILETSNESWADLRPGWALSTPFGREHAATVFRALGERTLAADAGKKNLLALAYVAPGRGGVLLSDHRLGEHRAARALTAIAVCDELSRFFTGTLDFLLLSTSTSALLTLRRPSRDYIVLAFQPVAWISEVKDLLHRLGDQMRKVLRRGG